MISLRRLVYFGTPAIALPTLQELVASGREVLRVVTQPPRPAGRGGALVESPVAAWARERGIGVLQPEKIRQPGFLDELRELAPDLAVVFAYGKIFPQALLDLPRHGCLNVHASLLPRWRGAAPIQAAIAAGDAETGVTIMRMEAGLDTGPMLLQRAIPIAADDTAATLAGKLATLGATLLVEALAGLEAGTVAETPQPAAGVTTAPTIRKDDGRVRWDSPAAEIAARLRAFTPWPGLTAELRGTPLRLVAARPGEAGEGDAAEPPGTWLGLRDGAAAIACGAGTVLLVERLQRPGRGAVAARDFANGERLARGERLT